MTSFVDICSAVGRWLLIIIITSVVVYGYFALKAYEDSAKRSEVSELYFKLNSLKVDYSEKILAGKEASNTNDLGLMVYDLKNYGLSIKEVIKTEENNAGTFKYSRNIELTPKKIIVTFDAGFDGDSDKTFIVEVSEILETGVKWSCTGGNLSNKYRPDRCKKK